MIYPPKGVLMYDAIRRYLYRKKKRIPEAAKLLYTKIIPISTKKVKICKIYEDGDFLKLLYNPNYLKKLTLHDASMCILHELYHAILGHLSKDFHKYLQNFGYTPKSINRGLDMEVNYILSKKFTLPNFFVIPNQEAMPVDVFKWSKIPYKVYWYKFPGNSPIKFPTKRTKRFIVILDLNSTVDKTSLKDIKQYIKNVMSNKIQHYTIFSTEQFGKWKLIRRTYAKDRFIYVFTS